MLLTYMAGLDLQLVFKILLHNFTLWDCPRASPSLERKSSNSFVLISKAGLPSAFSMVAGAVVALHPQLFFYSSAIMLSRVSMQYNTPFQCTVGFLLGLAILFFPELLGGTIVARIKKVLKRKEYLPVLCLAMAVRLLIKNQVLPLSVIFVPFLTTWIPILIQIVEP